MKTQPKGCCKSIELTFNSQKEPVKYHACRMAIFISTKTKAIQLYLFENIYCYLSTWFGVSPKQDTERFAWWN